MFKTSPPRSWGRRQYFLPLRRPLHHSGEGGRDVSCSTACCLIMGRELLLGWPGRVLEPVGLAQGGLATDPVVTAWSLGRVRTSARGLEHSSHSLLPWLPARVCVCVCVFMRQWVRERNAWATQCASMLIKTCVNRFMVSSFEGTNRTESTENPSDEDCLAIWRLHLFKTTRHNLQVEE